MQFIYGAGIEAFFKRTDELAAKYGAEFALETKAQETIRHYRPIY